MNEQGGNTVFDLTWNNHGTLINNAGWEKTAKGSGLKFPTDAGSDRLDLGSIDSSNPLSGVPSGQMSIAARVYKYASTDLNNSYPRIFDKSDGAGFQNGWGVFYQSSTALILQVQTNYLSVTIPSAAAWMDIVGTVKSGEWFLYNDGKSLGSGVSTASFSSTTTNAAIGNWNHTTDRQWNGQILYVYIWDRVISSDEAAWIHHEPYSIFEPRKSRRFVSVPASSAKSITDSGTGLDSVSGIQVVFNVSDSGIGADSVVAAIRKTISDAGTGLDAASFVNMINVSDFGSGVDVAAKYNLGAQVIVVTISMKKRSADFSLKQRHMEITFKKRSTSATLI
jgi:hypothetical protein